MGKLKLLIIDDEVEFASTLRMRLEMREIDAVDAHSGQQGLDVLEDVQPEVVLLDLRMPDMSGLVVLEAIKRQNPQTEVIMLTGHGSSGSGEEALGKGAFDYIMKPVDLKDLLVKIEAAVEKRKSATGE